MEFVTVRCAFDTHTHTTTRTPFARKHVLLCTQYRSAAACIQYQWARHPHIYTALMANAHTHACNELASSKLYISDRDTTESSRRCACWNRKRREVAHDAEHRSFNGVLVWSNAVADKILCATSTHVACEKERNASGMRRFPFAASPLSSTLAYMCARVA